MICIFAEPARFEFQSKNVTIRRGESVTIDCTVIGDNPIEVQWMHNSDRLDMSNHRLSIGQIKTDNGLKSQLSVANSDRQDSGVYRCTADNAYGRSEHLIYLAVQGNVYIRIENVLLQTLLVFYREARSSSWTRSNRDRFPINTVIMEASLRRKQPYKKLCDTISLAEPRYDR